jgi:hypothetical protein
VTSFAKRSDDFYSTLFRRHRPFVSSRWIAEPII